MRPTGWFILATSFLLTIGWYGALSRETPAQNELTSRFDQLADEWFHHCQTHAASSNIYDYLNCSAYRDLVKLGKPAIPLIIEQYKQVNYDEQGTDPRWWNLLLEDITGIKRDRSSIHVKDEQQFWLSWWNEQGHSKKPVNIR